jgi:DedD protein
VNDILKQRLVGALILLALAVVFWPIVFVEPEQNSVAQPRSIPEPPAVPTDMVEAPSQGELRGSPALDTQPADEELPGDSVDVVDEAIVEAATEDTATSAASVTPEISEARSQAPQPLAVDGDGVPVAWTLQVATVSSAANAESLRKRLLAKHEKAYITQVSSGGKQLYRVSVGPKFERHELERIQAGINAEFGVKTMLVRYLP